MNIKLQSIIQQIIPFIILGITLAFAVGLLIMFSYLLIWGLAIGATLWVIVSIKNYLFPKQSPSSKSDGGRIIEHEKRD
jgi:hypothetical protein